MKNMCGADNKKGKYMSSFKDIAYRILKKANKALHSKEITTIAIKAGKLQSTGKTPAATMGAKLYVDVNSKGIKSRFLKVGPSTFTINPTYKEEQKKKKLQPGEKRVMSEEFVKRAVISWLTRHGWGTNLEFGALNERGVDIKVRNNKYHRYFLIEVKGESSAKSARSIAETSFVYSLGQIVTRMNTGKSRYYYGLALPEVSAKIALRRLPWQAAKKLFLYLFSVNRMGKVIQYSWKDLKSLQK